MVRTTFMVALLMAACAADAAETTAYGYDALGRLVTSTTSGGPNNATSQQIGYDAAGNRSAYQVTGATPGSVSATKFIVVPLNGYTLIPIARSIFGN